MGQSLEEVSAFCQLSDRVFLQVHLHIVSEEKGVVLQFFEKKGVFAHREFLAEVVVHFVILLHLGYLAETDGPVPDAFYE